MVFLLEESRFKEVEYEFPAILCRPGTFCDEACAE